MKIASLKQVQTMLKAGCVAEAIPLIEQTVEQWNAENGERVRDLGRTAAKAYSMPPPQREMIERAISKIEINSPNLNEPLYNLLRPNFGDSYRIQRAAFHSIQRRSKAAPSRRIARKAPARKFAEALGLPLPEIYQFGVPLKDVDFSRPSVLKPASEDGGRAIHGLVPNGHIIQDIFNGQEHDENSLRRRLQDMLARRYVKSDAWIVEELLLAPGRDEGAQDVKFYTFYGRVGCVLQVNRWADPKAYTFFKPDMTKFDAGKYQNRRQEAAPIFTAEDVRMAEAISREIPWPGVRIDFLASRRGLVFGEFTLNPGAGGSFNQETDTYLGSLWADAQARLYDDMLTGRPFSHYRRFLEASPLQ